MLRKLRHLLLLDFNLIIIKAVEHKMAADEKLIHGLMRRFDHLKSKRGDWESYWGNLARYVIPAENEVHTYLNRSVGAEKNLQLYDSSAVHYNELLASALHSMLTNPATTWFELSTGVKELDENSEVRAYLQKVVAVIHNIFNNSNFHTEAHNYYLGLGSFGTSFLHIMEDDEDVVRFKNRQVFGAYIDQSYKGFVNTAYLPFKLSNRNLLEKYGDRNIPEETLKKMTKNLDEEQEVVLIIIPRSKYDGRRKDAKNMPFASYHVMTDGKILLKESGYQEQPFACSRWSVATEEMYGRSPSMKTLPDNRMLQQIMRTTIRGAQKIVDPPLLIPDDSTVAPNTTPGGMSSYRAGTQDFVRPLQTGGNPGLGLEMMSDVRERIKQGYYIDQLQLPQGPQKTATEVNALLQEQLKLFGPILGRQENEFLKPMINRQLGIMKRKKLMPADMPDVLAKAALNVTFSSQIAKAQRLSEIQSVDTWLMSMANMAQFKPEAVIYIDEAGYAKYSARVYNVPSDIIRSDEEVKKIQDAQAKAAQEQQKLDQAGQEAEIANKVG